ncbi:MAG: hypothetical protein K2X27_17705, partial [Candidatus Obscuribacterales bacterium]|nr:hypothetical protein [Candidatus Obscuribacterales bacterium]
SRFVVLNSQLANITAQRFALPKDTFAFPLAGMVVFPYYQATPELQEFLNNSRINNIPITSYGPTPYVAPNLLPPTDLVRMNIPIPTIRPDKGSFTKLALKNKGNSSTPWVVAHQNGQAFYVPGDRDACVLASQGTMLNACSLKTLALRCGTLWVLTGSQHVNILTKYGAVQVKPYSIAAVEQTWFNRVRAASLNGHPLEIQLAYKENKSRFSVEKGKEVTLSENSVASLGASDYVDASSSPTALASKTPSGASAINIDSISKKLDPDVSNFLTELKGINPPLENMRMISMYKQLFANYGVTTAMRRDAVRKQILQKDLIAAKPAYKASLDSRYFVPVARPVASRGPLPFPRVDEALKTTWVQSGVLKYLSRSAVELDENGRLNLNSGEFLFEAKDASRLRVRDCFLNIEGGAIVHISAKKNVIVVRNLKELANQSLTLRVDSRYIKIPAASELIVAADLPSIFSEMKNDGVNRRNVQSIESNENLFVNKSEIELTSLLQYNPLMRALLESKDQNDQKIASQIVKTDAVLQMVVGNKRGNYQRMAGLPVSH